MIVIAHLSDLHIDDAPRSVERTRAVLAYLDSLPVDLTAVVVTGDIADHGRPGEYDQARRSLTSRHPVLICPGNHDDRAAFREVLLRQPPSPAPVNQLYRAEGCLIALCDSTVPGRDDGLLDDTTLAWLAEVLALPPHDLPVLIGFHHPPVPLHMPFVDSIRQFGAERLAELVERHPRVAALLCGHAHTAGVTTFAGRPLLVAPGVVSTVRLPWERRAHPADHVDLDQEPALAFHVLDDAGSVTTHFRHVRTR